MFKTAFTLLLASGVAMAAQDSAFYSKFVNRNVNNGDMYYRDAINVLQDLADSQFDALFIRYHGCV
jgi:hypothetical protein